MKKIVILSTLVIILYFIWQNSLTIKIKTLLWNKDCQVGVAVINKEDKWLINNNETYPMMSVFKTFIAAAVLEKAEKDNTDLAKEFIITNDMIYPTHSPLKDKIKNYPYHSNLRELLYYMVAQSDNIACRALLIYLGGIDKLKEFVSAKGFDKVVIKVDEKQMNDDIQKQQLNRAQPEDIALFIQKVYEGEILSSKQTEIFKQIMLETNTGNNKLKAGLPTDILIGHKTGSSNRGADNRKVGDNDAGFVILPNGKVYYIVVMIKNSAMSDEENASLTAQISKQVYQQLSRK